MLVLYTLALFLASAVLCLLAPGLYLAMSWQRYRGLHVVTCPETGVPVEVALDARRAAVTTLARRPRLRLVACSRWPQRQECGQECARQIETG